MDHETIFRLANLLALVGWLLLLLSPVLPARLCVLPRLVVPSLLALAYVALILSGWSGAEGGFSSLADVTLLFSAPAVVLAGWLHFLAFDLFVGAWEVEDARARGLAFLLVVPCLALTFLFGPAGLLLYLAVRWTLARGPAPAALPGDRP